MSRTSCSFCEKVFKYDRLAREALALLCPEFRSSDLTPIEPAIIGPRIADLGHRLYHEGTLIGLPVDWEMEESPEIARSLEMWRTAISERSCAEFTRLTVAAAREALAGWLQLGKLAPRLSILRWTACMKWMEARAVVINENSVGGAFGSIDPAKSAQGIWDVKAWILEQLREFVNMPEILSMIDYDLQGNGVWRRTGREEMPEEAKKNDWYRRGTEFDVAQICLQVERLPPQALNEYGDGPPKYELKALYGDPDWLLKPQDAARFVLEKHGWGTRLEVPGIDLMPAKEMVLGKYLVLEQPPPFEHDLEDPEVVAKVQRGEDLGKGDQEDGLPGAIHGSIALLYASMCATEDIDMIRFHPSILEIEGFVEALLRYCPPIRCLDFGGCSETITKDTLRLLQLGGDSMFYLDLEACGLDYRHVDVLVESLGHLTGLKSIDLSSNRFDDNAAICLVMALCHGVESSAWDFGRIDIATVRLDGNQLENTLDFRDKVAAMLAERGGSTINGGTTVQRMDNEEVLWRPGPKQGGLINEVLEKALRQIPCTDIRQLERSCILNNRKLDERVEQDPHHTRLPAYLWRREFNARLLDHPIIQAMKEERNVIGKLNEEKKEREEAERAARLAAGEESPEGSPPPSPGIGSPTNRFSHAGDATPPSRISHLGEEASPANRASRFGGDSPSSTARRASRFDISEEPASPTAASQNVRAFLSSAGGQ
eukprot:TRINITY_DN14158_c0_g1_i1.p1 TRINITY_DN14158_c0_g1~~TRINITY_DN14158_c0_g1_i1.p1  ORF type:complete len:714 (+),score=178.68 TRINITY_DN14158_c0_g1_i1:444-2585(+)